VTGCLAKKKNHTVKQLQHYCFLLPNLMCTLENKRKLILYLANCQMCYRICNIKSCLASHTPPFYCYHSGDFSRPEFFSCDASFRNSRYNEYYKNKMCYIIILMYYYQIYLLLVVLCTEHMQNNIFLHLSL
jgi:hypothetical protein